MQATITAESSSPYVEDTEATGEIVESKGAELTIYDTRGYYYTIVTATETDHKLLRMSEGRNGKSRIKGVVTNVEIDA